MPDSSSTPSMPQEVASDPLEPNGFATAIYPSPPPHPARSTAPREEHAPDAESAARCGRFTILRPHAQGGLGKVFLANDEELRRPVALKQMHPRLRDNDASFRRFVQEAEITARLEHPGIVPVHGFILDAGGQPCYAMRFIQGESLTEAVRRFHASKLFRRSPSQRSLALRQLLNRFVAVCNTVAFAHSRGYIHRDVKPDNVMLGSFGETVLLDWGLAKEVNSSECAVLIAELQASPAEGATATQEGQALGTPAFMSPEQASGQRELTGPANDIYSLGATLYVILTGQVPFHHLDLRILLEQVQRGLFATPREFDPSIPRPLEAICLKAMSLRPEDRYPGALDLAADVESWLAGEPVTAYAEPWLTRAGRWRRRHRALVSSIAAAGTAAIVLLTWATVALDASRRQAETNFTLARKAVDQFYTQVSESRGLQAHNLEKERLAMLRTAKEFYEEFAQQRSNDPDLQAELGRALVRLGDITFDIDPNGRPIDHLEKAAAIFKNLTRKFPRELRYRTELVRTLNRLGYFERVARHYELAETYWRQALQQAEQLAMAAPNDITIRGELARAHYHLGTLAIESDLARSEQSLLQAIALQEPMVHALPGETRFQEHLAESLYWLAHTYRNQGRWTEALATMQRAARIQEVLTSSLPDVPSYHIQLASSYNDLSVLYLDRWDVDRAETPLEKSLKLMEAQARNHPDVLLYQRSLAIVLNNLGEINLAKGKLSEAAAFCKRSQDVWTVLAKKQPRSVRVHAPYSECLEILALVYQARGWDAEARECLRQSLAALNRARAIESSSDLAIAHARLLIRVNQLADGINEASQVELGDGAPGKRFADLAAVYALASGADGATQSEDWAAHAVTLLRQAAAKKHANPCQWRKDPDFSALRERSDFRRLLDDLGEKETTSQPMGRQTHVPRTNALSVSI